MHLTSSSHLEKEITVGDSVKVKIDLAFDLVRVFKKDRTTGRWNEKSSFRTYDMSFNECIEYLENLQKRVLLDEEEEKKFQTVEENG